MGSLIFERPRPERWTAIFSLCLLALLATVPSVLHAAEPSVGMVTRVQNEATVVSAGTTQTARVGTVLHLNDELRTGDGSRLQVTFRDNTRRSPPKCLSLALACPANPATLGAANSLRPRAARAG